MQTSRLFPSRHVPSSLPGARSSDSSQEEPSREVVVLLEERLDMEKRLESKEERIRELQHMLDVAGVNSQKLKPEEGERNGATKLLSSASSGNVQAGGNAASLTRLNKQLEEADRAKAVAEEEAEGLRETLATRDQELREATERLARLVEERVSMSLRLDSQKDIHTELLEKRREVDTLHQKLHDLQRSLISVKQERDNIEKEVHEKVQQQRADARKHQAAILEKNNEIGALRRQLAERSGTGGKMLKMSIDMVCLRHAKEKLEADLKAKDEELASLKSAMKAGGSSSSSSINLEETHSDSSAPSDGQSQDIQSPSLDEIHSMYGEQVTTLEEELRRLREELEGKHSELTERGREYEETEQENMTLKKQLEVLRKEHEESQQQLRNLEMLRATASAERRNESSSAAELANTMEEQIIALEMELEKKEGQIENLKYEVFELKKKLKMSAEQGGAAAAAVKQQRLEALEKALANSEAEKELLQHKSAQMQQELMDAERQRVEIEQILQQTEDGLDQYYEEAKRKVEQYYREAQQCREDLKKTTEQAESLRRQLLDTQRASQLQVSKLHKAKKQVAKDTQERIGQLEAQLEEKRKLENELRVRLQRGGADAGGGRTQQAMMEGLRNELNKVRTELQRVQELLEREHASRVKAEDMAEQRKAQVEILQERINTSFRKERESLVREMEAHQQTKQELEREKEETGRSRRFIRELEEYKDSVTNIAIQDRRKPGHRLHLRPKQTFNCRSCRGVKHGFMWKCQDRNCQDIFCTDCLGNGSAG